jgi:hypothetical protein
MTASEADRRSLRGLQAVQEAWTAGSLYAQVWTALDRAGLRAPAPEVCRQKMRRAWDREKTHCSNSSRTSILSPSMRNIMTDPLEAVRRARLAEINRAPGAREQLEAKYGQVWDTEELTRDFEVLGFLAPYVVVRRRSDGMKGSLEFQHRPRHYFNFSPHHS